MKIVGLLLFALSATPAATRCVNTIGMTDAQIRALQDDACTAIENVATTGDAKRVRAITPAFRSAVERAVRDNLKDPRSSQFKLGPTLHRSGPYCGMVNSRNSYGGYVGFTPFMVSVSPIGKDGVRATFGSLGDETAPLCEAAGY